MSQDGASPTQASAAAPAASGSPASGPQAAGANAAAAPATGKAAAPASLYVGDLLPDVTEALLFDIFNAVGPVASVRVCRDAATRRSLGYGYVNFHRAEDAERALDTMNFASIRGQPCRIMWSHRDPSLRRSGAGNIFVKNLDPSIDNKTLYDTFSMFGNILSCKVVTSDKGSSLGYGFVHFETEESAKSAIEQVDGMEIAGHEVVVQAFKSRQDRQGNADSFTNVFAKNLPEEMTDEEFRALFEKHGVVTSVSIQKTPEGKSRCFGFVNFEEPKAAAEAVEALNGFEVQEKKIFVARAQKKAERERELRRRFEEAKLERQKKYAGVNLYVKNLTENTDKDKVVEEFSKFGSITSARVMLDENGKSKGFGFVCFSTPEEATKAVTEMNGKMLDGKPLYVALAQRKEVRQAQLEAQYAARAKATAGAAGPHGMIYPPQFYGQQRGMPPQPGAFPPMMGFQQQLPPQQMQQMYAQQQYAQQQYAQQHPHMQQQQHPHHQQQRGPRRGPHQKKGGGRNGQQQGGQPQQGQFPQHAMQQQQQQQQAQGQMMAPPAAQPLTVEALTAAPVEQQKKMIGERLFPLILARQPERAGKITGMLLEMDNGELLHLLESNDALTSKVNEAVEVLVEHERQTAGGASE